MDFLYDVFFEVLSEEGVWVLILIASAFAVASFILLTLRVETNPRQAAASQREENPAKEMKKKKQKKATPEKEAAASEPETDLAPSPKLTVPGDSPNPETTPDRNIPLPIGQEPPAAATQPAPGLILDPFDVTAMPGLEATATGAEQAPPPAGDLVPMSIAGQTPEQAAGATFEGTAETPEDDNVIMPGDPGDTDEFGDDEGSEGGKKSKDGDIFDLFEEVEEENTELSEFAKDLDNVAVTGLLSDTEDLSQELKDIFGRR